MRLERGHLNTKDALAFRRQGRKDVFFETAQHKGLKLLMQLLDLLLMINIIEIKLVCEQDCCGE